MIIKTFFNFSKLIKNNTMTDIKGDEIEVIPKQYASRLYILIQYLKMLLLVSQP